ncbi:MAG: hypothetical protein P9L99_05880 [Candidatus Lernaella stagnicola]|nr:hypothetical protein [Candidatus Lernaella stagnicola]
MFVVAFALLAKPAFVGVNAAPLHSIIPRPPQLADADAKILAKRLQPLSDRHLMLGGAVAWDLQSKRSIRLKKQQAKRAEVARRYGEIRQCCLDLRGRLRSEKRATALAEVEKLLPHLLIVYTMPPWQGTTWDFNGASDTPGQGQIACGYFVAQILYAAGFDFRNKSTGDGRRLFPFAMLASEPAMKKLIAPQKLKRFSDSPVKEVETWLRSQGDGVYLVGLDQHFATLIVSDGRIWIWHAKPGHDVRFERPADAPFFAESRYRVVGKLGPKAAQVWLDGVRL